MFGLAALEEHQLEAVPRGVLLGEGVQSSKISSSSQSPGPPHVQTPELPTNLNRDLAGT